LRFRKFDPGEHAVKDLRLGSIAMLILLAAGPAMAADMQKAPILKALPKPIYNWTGFYIGGNLGYGWGRGDTDFTDSSTSVVTEFRGSPPLTVCPTPLACPALPAGFGAATLGGASGGADINGVLGGGQIGYNAQFNNWVLGLEADIQATGQRGSVALLDPINNVLATVNDKMPWFATFRGRVGITLTPTWLLYATGGAALAEVNQDFAVGTPGGAVTAWSANSTRWGWVVGGGAEAAIENTNWTIKGEFLHMDFGSVGSSMATGTTTTTLLNFPAAGFSSVVAASTAASFNSRMTDNIVRVGLNYRLSSR
jgi:outer membrane immunogenic protein